MKIYRFDVDVGKEIEQFGSVKAIVSRILHLEDKAEISSVYIRPGGNIGRHRAVVPQLFLVVQGEGWVSGGTNEKNRRLRRAGNILGRGGVA